MNNKILINDVIVGILNNEANKGTLKVQLEMIKKNKDLKNRVIDGVFDKLFSKDSKIGWWAKTSAKIYLSYKYGI